MINKKTILILGGTGFVGRAILEKYCRNNYNIIVPTRSKSNQNAKDKILNHGFDNQLLEDKISDGSIIFLLNVDLYNIESILLEIKERGLLIDRVINLASETLGRIEEIVKKNDSIINNVLILVDSIRSKNKECIFMNMGSVSERREEKELSYESSKKSSKDKIISSNTCDFHFVVGYIKGRGELKMTKVAPLLWSKLKYSTKWFFGFSVSVIDVDDLADAIFYLTEVVRYNSRHKPVEVSVTNGELVFGEVIKNLLEKSNQSIPRRVIPRVFENLFLNIYIKIIPLIKPSDQFSFRLVKFAKRALRSENKENNLLMTVSDIKKLRENSHYELIETKPFLIIASNERDEMFMVKERTSSQIEESIKKSV